MKLRKKIKNIVFVEIKTTKFIDSILIAIYGGLYACSIALLGVHFIYRYGSLDSVKKFRYFEGYRLIYWGMIPVIFTVFWSFIAYFIFPQSSEYNEVIRAELWEIYGINIDNISYIGEYLFDENIQGIQPIMFKSVVGLLLHSTMISASMFTVFYFGFVCYLSIRKSLKSKSKSSSTDRLQRQYFYALVVQTVIPLICLYIPILIAFSCAITLQNIGGFSKVVSIGMALYPALDPLPTLLIVKSYRNALLNMIFRGKIIGLKVSSVIEPSKTFHRVSIVNKI
ncbi:unnamed protein product [Caenorhabditis angaria]|uniref:Seven TM Receptor n=1 Tax=Caenorhabditis angaria TaxID=860376 RepID=A0A9P1ISG0_9PELO|nr:unnamed protein product [Caenorhabditis angaria]